MGIPSASDQKEFNCRQLLPAALRPIHSSGAAMRATQAHGVASPSLVRISCGGRTCCAPVSSPRKRGSVAPSWIPACAGMTCNRWWGYGDQAAPSDIELRFPPRNTIRKECGRPDEEPRGVAQGDEPPFSGQERVFHSVHADGESHGQASRQGNAQVAYCRNTRRRDRGCRERPGQALCK